MIFWEGFGFLVLITYFAVALPVQLLTDKLGLHYSQNGYAIAIAFLLTGVVLLGLDALIHKKRAASSRIYIDKETGEEVFFKKRDTFFWISVKWWGLIAIAASICTAVVFLIAKLISH